MNNRTLLPMLRRYPRPSATRVLCLAASVALAALLLLAALPGERASAAMTNVPLEAEGYTPTSAQAYVVDDGRALGGEAMRLDAGGQAHEHLDTTGPISFFEARARGGDGSCTAPLELLYRHEQADGTWGAAQTLGTRDVTSTGYVWVQWSGLDIPGGDNRIVLRNRCASTPTTVDYTDYDHDPDPPPPSGGPDVDLGAFGGNVQWGDTGTLDAYASRAGRAPAIINVFQAFKWDGDYVGFDRGGFDTLQAKYPKSTIMLTWEPRAGGCCGSSSVTPSSIASGSHDAYVRSFARAVAQFPHRIQIRLGHEMNGGWYPWGRQPTDYVEMYRHVHDVFQQEGATNVDWVWCPNVIGPTHRGTFDQYYPGDAYVDFTGLDGYNWYTTRDMPWYTFDEVFGRSVAHMGTFAPDKPLIIAETASHETNDGRKAQWIDGMRSSIAAGNYPTLVAVLWFSNDQEGATWRIDSARDTLDAYRSMADGRYETHGNREASRGNREASRDLWWRAFTPLSGWASGP